MSAADAPAQQLAIVPPIQVSNADSNASSSVAAPAHIAPPEASAAPAPNPPVVNGDPVDNEPNGTVRLIGIITEIGKKFAWLAPNIPIPPFKGWHQWMKDHEIAVHCALEWKDNKGRWWNAEMRSSKWDHGSTEHRVGMGQFPCTGYYAYGIFICPGRYPRVIDLLDRPITVTLDEVIPKCDYRTLEYEIRKYGAYGKKSNDLGTGGYGKENCGLGGPAYKPGQNSNTMVNYVLRKCGIHHCAPDLTAGWDTEPTFPYSTDTRYPKYNE